MLIFDSCLMVTSPVDKTNRHQKFVFVHMFYFHQSLEGTGMVSQRAGRILVFLCN